MVSWTEPTVTDNSGSYTLTTTHSPASSFDIGNTIVTYIAVDESGNKATYSFVITVTGMILSLFMLSFLIPKWQYLNGYT